MHHDVPERASRSRSGPADPVLVVRNVVCRFEGQLAVDDVSFEVGDGEFLFLIGPSGCGKTTTLRMIGGYLEPTAGDILIRGRRMNGVPLEKRNIGMVFQTYALFPHMTVAENVAFGLRMRGVRPRERAERVAAALDLVELRAYADRYPVQLSGGQRQRVAIARVVVYEPDILLLDEPLANLDKRLRDSMRIELKKLQEKIGITTVYVTHDQEEALSMADRIAVMDGGRLLQIGMPSEIYNSPTSSFVATFLGDTTSLRGVVAEVLPDRTMVTLDGGLRVATARVGGIEPGAPCVMSIRPERVRLGRLRPAAADNVFRTVVEAMSYLGADVEYLLRLEGSDLALRAAEPLPNGIPSFREGDHVFVSWNADQTVCLRA